MKKVNVRDISEREWESPKGKFAGRDREISIALGREPMSMEMTRRHPFDVEICRIPPGKKACPYHSHSAQWEFYHVISGNGQVRDASGLTAIGKDDAFIFKPSEAHQVINDGAEDLVIYIIADNPIGQSDHYPDSGKWFVRSPKEQFVRSEALDYLDGEE